jgi:hypothetical protein
MHTFWMNDELKESENVEITGEGVPSVARVFSRGRGHPIQHEEEKKVNLRDRRNTKPRSQHNISRLLNSSDIGRESIAYALAVNQQNRPHPAQVIETGNVRNNTAANEVNQVERTHVGEFCVVGANPLNNDQAFKCNICKKIVWQSERETHLKKHRDLTNLREHIKRGMRTRALAAARQASEAQRRQEIAKEKKEKAQRDNANLPKRASQLPFFDYTGEADGSIQE